MSDSESTTQAGPPPADMDEIFVEHPFRQFVAMYFRNYAAVAGLLVFVTIVGAALFAPMILDLDPFEMVDEPLLRPGEGGHLLGTDNLGRDLFIAIVYGARVTMAVGGAAAGITLFIGLTIGAMAGFYRGWVDEVLMRVTEFFQVLPPLLLAMVLV
ncbi:MAG: ABC transporter permease, partial [Rhodospirillaceae bacterium]|nr:ABC transporter permease [Rhodospirillaceae bacterium]